MANKASETVQIDVDQFQQLKEYSDITGVPIKAAIEEALSDFIECCISARLESIQARLHKA